MKKILCLIVCLLLFLPNLYYAETKRETITTYVYQNSINHLICTEVWEYNVQSDGSLTSGHPIDALSSSIEEKHAFDNDDTCTICGYHKTVVFEAEAELIDTLGIVDISQTVAVFQYFYDTRVKKYSVPMQTEVKQVGLDSWVRVKLNAYRTIRTTKENEDLAWDIAEVGILDADGNLVEEGTSDYVVIGDYVYYTKILPKGYSLYVAYYARFSNYNQLYTSSYVGTTPSADAIQGVNFYPDFTSEEPWYNIDIEEKEKNETIFLGDVSSTIITGEDYVDINAQTIDEETGEEKLLTEYAMPGDDIILNTSLIIEGQEDETYEVSHKLQVIGDMPELISSIVDKLTIWLSVDNEEKQQIYADDNILDNWQIVGKFIKGQILNFFYKFSLVPELNNDFESEQFNVKAQYIGVIVPTATPTVEPTTSPTEKPTVKPTESTTASPTTKPSIQPTTKPTIKPTITPTLKPTITPTSKPTVKPTTKPTTKPTIKPTIKPTVKPTITPTIQPTLTPTAKPTIKPTTLPTIKPTITPTIRPTIKPTSKPTTQPTHTPTIEPTNTPTIKPTTTPTIKPTSIPTPNPTSTPTPSPTITTTPTISPSSTPTRAPTSTPTIKPTLSPTFTPEPTLGPTPQPTLSPQKRKEILKQIEHYHPDKMKYFESLTDEELEDLLDIFGYNTPLYGILPTGDDVSFGFYITILIGWLAILILIFTKKKT